MSKGALKRALKHAVYDRVGYLSSSGCPLETTIGDALQELLPPPLPEDEVVAVGVRDLVKLKQMKAVGCQKCSDYKSIRACGHCFRRPRERDPHVEQLSDTTPSSSLLPRIDRLVEHGAIEPDVSQARDMPLQSSVDEMRR
eukprot:TRINITY_DN17635_c1_g3_i4.p1 TRINITY_DN17635_c1_g3~~TRINITY_DN17635_c1_g3_i4.p1  ORF type:complete len:141 (+),score=9.22 TRINITY_DN17635_c1_g3_i4:87-509(+)